MWGDTKALLAEDTPEPKAGQIGSWYQTQEGQYLDSSQSRINPSSSVLLFLNRMLPHPILRLAVFLQPEFSWVQYSRSPLHSRAFQRSVDHWFSPAHAGGLVRHRLLNLTPELLTLIGPLQGLQTCTSNNLTGYWCCCPGITLWQLLLLTRAVWTF